MGKKRFISAISQKHLKFWPKIFGCAEIDTLIGRVTEIHYVIHFSVDLEHEIEFLNYVKGKIFFLGSTVETQIYKIIEFGCKQPRG